MADINLHQVAEKELRIKRSSSIMKSSTFISFGLLFLILLIYGATILYRSSLENTKANIIQAKEKELKSIDTKSINELIDFQLRLDGTTANLENKNNPKDTLDAIERLIVKGVFLNKLVRNDVENKVEIEAVCDSFKLAASQMLSFKKSDVFSNVKITDSGRDDSGRVVFLLEIDL